MLARVTRVRRMFVVKVCEDSLADSMSGHVKAA